MGFLKNPLVYPGIQPGFNKLHPASRGYLSATGGASVVCTGTSNLISVLGGTVTNNSTPTFRMDGYIGPGAVYSGSGQSSQITGLPSLSSNNFTLGAIFRADSANASLVNSIVGFSSGTLIYIGSGGILELYVGSGHGLQIIVTFGVPYFVAYSSSPLGESAVLTNLNTGQVSTLHSTGTPIALSIGSTFLVGNFSIVPSTDYLNGPVAAAMYSSVGLSFYEMVRWANDPWSFWYPQQYMPEFKSYPGSDGGGNLHYRQVFTSIGNIGSMAIY